MPSVGAEAPRVPDGLRAYLHKTLPGHLVPSVLIAVAALPTTASGKIDRMAVASYASDQRVAGRPPATELEHTVCAIMAEILERPDVGPDENFFDLGGHSVRAARLVARLHAVLGTEPPLAAVFEAPTPARLAARLYVAHDHADNPSTSSGLYRRLFALREVQDTEVPPLWFIHSGGGLCWPYLPFSAHLPPDRAVLGIQARGFDREDTLPASIEEVVDDYARRILARQLHGPFHLVGYSIGGTLAHAVATQLQADGHEIELLAMLDSVPAEVLARHEPPSLSGLRDYFRAQAGDVGTDVDRLVERAVAMIPNLTAHLTDYATPTFVGDALLVRAGDDAHVSHAHDWRDHVTGTVHAYTIAATHKDLIEPRHVPELCRLLGQSVGPLQKEHVHEY